MATYIQKYWAAQDLQAVSLTQTLGAAGNLSLNGTYFNPTTSTINFTTQGFARNVSLTSVNNLSTATFTIFGVQNNTVISSTIAGPNNNTVYTTDVFDIISSISVNMAVNGIKVGTGLTGYFPIINRIIPNSFSVTTPSSAYALGFSTEASNGATYQVYQSLVDLTGNAETYSALIADSSLISVNGPYSNVTQILQKNDVCADILVSVTSANASSTLTMEFLQF
jgi:hypothetical protein